MKEILKQMFSEANNQISSGRVMAFATVVCGLTYLFIKSDWQGAVAVIGLGLTAKVVQKYGE